MSFPWSLLRPPGPRGPLAQACAWILALWAALSLAACGGGSDTEAGDTVFAVSVPVIDTQPASQAVAEGDAVVFTVSASGGNLSYQWMLDGTSLSDATTATLTLPSVSSSDAGTYRVLVTHTAGSTLSAAAVLTVTSSTAEATQSGAVLAAARLE